MSCCGEEDPPKNEGRALLHEGGVGGYQTAPDMTYSVGGKDTNGLVVKEPAAQKRIREADLPPDTTLQCKRCRRIYKVEENGPEKCRYHNGRFVKGSTAPMSSTKWTCCKSYSRTEPGCKRWVGPRWNQPLWDVIARNIMGPNSPVPNSPVSHYKRTQSLEDCSLGSCACITSNQTPYGKFVYHDNAYANFLLLPHSRTRYANSADTLQNDLTGEGFVGRALLHSAGVEFNDDRVPLETWETVKATTPYGHVPFYQDDTVGVLTESGTIYRYLARAHGFAGSTAIEQVRVDEIFEIYFDIFRAAQKAYFGADAGGETVVRESETLSRQKFLANAVPQYVALTTRLLARNGNRGFLVGNSLTLADFQAFHVLNNWLRPLSPAAIAEVQPYLDGVRKANARFNSYLTNGGVAVTTEPSVFTFLNTPELFQGEFDN